LIVLSEVVVIVVVMERKQRRGVRLDDGEEVKLPAQSKNNTEKKTACTKGDATRHTRSAAAIKSVVDDENVYHKGRKDNTKKGPIKNKTDTHFEGIRL
jgi:ribosome-associated protein YbcJ (S4-like RNA binding protein)